MSDEPVPAEPVEEHRCEQWGVGNKADSKAFDTALMGKQDEVVELIHGEHPHIRGPNNTYARWADGDIDGFDGHRRLVDVQLHSTNYLKTSHYSGNQIRKAGTCTISIDRVQVYEFFYRDPPIGRSAGVA